MAEPPQQPTRADSRDELRLLGLLKDWHHWAATFAEAPRRVDCRRCGNWLGTIYEPDGIRVPWEAHWIAERGAYRYAAPRYASGEIASSWNVVGRPFPFVQDRYGYGHGRGALRYRLALPCNLCCTDSQCLSTTSVELPKYRLLSELRKLAKRVLPSSPEQVVAAYEAWQEAIGGRKLPLHDVTARWPYALAQDITGSLADEDVYLALNPREERMPEGLRGLPPVGPRMVRSSQRAAADHDAQGIDAAEKPAYTGGSSRRSSVRGCYRHE